MFRGVIQPRAESKRLRADIACSGVERWSNSKKFWFSVVLNSSTQQGKQISVEISALPGIHAAYPLQYCADLFSRWARRATAGRGGGSA